MAAFTSTRTAWTAEKERASTAGNFEDNVEVQPSSLALAYKRYRVGDKIRSHQVEVAIYLVYLFIMTWSEQKPPP